MTERHEICPATELAPGERTIVEVANKSIGVFNLDGDYYGMKNVCPHQLAPLCTGELTGTFAGSEVGEYRWEREGQIVRCPWHGWEFDVTTGESVFEPQRWRVRTYEATVEAPETDDSKPQTGEQPCEGASVETFPVEVEDGVVVVYV